MKRFWCFFLLFFIYFCRVKFPRNLKIYFRASNLILISAFDASKMRFWSKFECRAYRMLTSIKRALTGKFSSEWLWNRHLYQKKRRQKPDISICAIVPKRERLFTLIGSLFSSFSSFLLTFSFLLHFHSLSSSKHFFFLPFRENLLFF